MRHGMLSAALVTAPDYNWSIRPAELSERRHALSLLFVSYAGSDANDYVDELISADQDGTFPLDDLFVAEIHGKIVGVGLMAVVPGQTILAWPPSAAQSVSGSSPVTAKAICCDLARAMRARIQRAENCLAQCLLHTGHAEHDLLSVMGLQHTLDLVELSLPLDGLSAIDGIVTQQSRTNLTAVSFAEAGSLERVAAVLEATFVDSADAPETHGFRSAVDALGGHLAVGTFREDLSRIYVCEGQDVGLVLVAEHSTQRSLELLYIGLTPDARGRGYGRQMLKHLTDAAQETESTILTCAVDARNSYAIKIYREAGFQFGETQEVWLYQPQRSERPQ